MHASLIRSCRQPPQGEGHPRAPHPRELRRRRAHARPARVTASSSRRADPMASTFPTASRHPCWHARGPSTFPCETKRGVATHTTVSTRARRSGPAKRRERLLSLTGWRRTGITFWRFEHFGNPDADCSYVLSSGRAMRLRTIAALSLVICLSCLVGACRTHQDAASAQGASGGSLNRCQRAVAHFVACVEEHCRANPSVAGCPVDAAQLSEGASAEFDVDDCSEESAAAADRIIERTCADMSDAVDRALRREVTSEATLALRRLFDSVVAYYDAHGELPLPAAMTPARIPCGESVALDADDWASSTYSELGFSVVPATRYSFRVDMTTPDGEPGFTVGAYGDLDCDGVISTFQRIGFLEPGGSIGGSAGLYMWQELE